MAAAHRPCPPQYSYPSHPRTESMSILPGPAASKGQYGHGHLRSPDGMRPHGTLLSLPLVMIRGNGPFLTGKSQNSEYRHGQESGRHHHDRDSEYLGVGIDPIAYENAQNKMMKCPEVPPMTAYREHACAWHATISVDNARAGKA
jgi:hypothetical protein